MGEYLCIECGNYFCSKDLEEHQQQLMIKFENEIVKPHQELIEQIENLNPFKSCVGGSFRSN